MYGRRRSRSPDGGSDPGLGWNSVTGLLRMSTYIGVSDQYKVEGPLGASLTGWIQNLGTAPAPQRGEPRSSVLAVGAHVRGAPQEGLA